MSIRKLLILIVLILVSIITTISIVLLPAQFAHYNVKGKGEIGDIIGGISSPIVGIASIVLLYLALIKQIEANRDQHQCNEVDLVLSLIDQLENEIQTFYYKFYRNKEEIKYIGLEGLNEFILDSRLQKTAV